MKRIATVISPGVALLAAVLASGIDAGTDRRALPPRRELRLRGRVSFLEDPSSVLHNVKIQFGRRDHGASERWHNVLHLQISLLALLPDYKRRGQAYKGEE